MKKVSPKKHFGQHFLKKPSIAKKIATSLQVPSGNILEIGPGTGVLTQFLLNPQHHLKVVEIDKESVDYLQHHFPGLNIIEGDFLQINLSGIFNHEEFSLVGNFPYNISSQIIFKAIENKHIIPEICGMFQKEVAERIAAKEGSKIYGILSVLTQAFYNVKYCFSVDEKSFSPPPKVKSGVIHCTRKKNYQLPVDEKLFFQIVKTAFNQRRKTLKNSLSSISIIPSKYASLRAEQLTVDDFINLTNHIQKSLP